MWKLISFDDQCLIDRKAVSNDYYELAGMAFDMCSGEISFADNLAAEGGTIVTGSKGGWCYIYPVKE